MAKKTHDDNRKTVATRRAFLKTTALVGASAATVAAAGCGSDKTTIYDPCEPPCGTGGAAGTGGAGGTGGAAGGTGGAGGGGPARPIIYPDQDNSEVRWGFLIDLRRCVGCQACAVACKTEFDMRLGYFRNGVIEHTTGAMDLSGGTLKPGTVARNFVPWLCNHCKNPPCMNNCPVEEQLECLTFPSGAEASYWARATYQRPDGLVLVDQSRCVGCGSCVTDCPYQVRYLDPVKAAGGDPTERAADKCSMCIQRLENGVVPACVNTCPHDARMIGNINDPASAISVAIAQAGSAVSGIMETVGTEPQCFYIDLVDDAYTNGDEPRREAGLQTQIT